MKKILLLISVIILSSQTKVINKDSNRDIESPVDNRELIYTFRGEYITPKSTHIGQLPDYTRIEIDVFKVLASTLDSIVGGTDPETLLDSYKFIFNTYIQKELLEGGEIKSWRVGEGYSDAEKGEYPIELIYEEYSLYGYIYLIKKESWKVIDIQLQKDMKRVLDPSNPILY